jgi:hypothetical protein
MLKRVGFVVAVVTAATLAGTERAVAATIFTNEATFITSSGPLAFESFEALTATNSVAGGFVAALTNFTLTASPLAGVFDLADYVGTHATDGIKFIEVEGGTQQVLTFTFGVPIVEFGVTITDYGDVIGGVSQLTFLTNTGVTGAAVTGPLANGSDRFFGLTDTTPFTSISFTTPVGPFGDPFSVDRVFSTQAAAAAPEPAFLVLLGTGVAAGLRAARSRRR